MKNEIADICRERARNGFSHDDDFENAALEIDRLHARVVEEKQLHAKLRDVLVKFVAHYPSGINPYLDEAYREASDAINEGKGECT